MPTTQSTLTLSVTGAIHRQGFAFGALSGSGKEIQRCRFGNVFLSPFQLLTDRGFFIH